MAGPCSAARQAHLDGARQLWAGVEGRKWLPQKRIVRVGVMEEHRAEGCSDAREYDPWAHPGRVTAEFRKRQVTVTGERI